MLPATLNPLVLKWFDGWCRGALRRAFHRVHVYGADQLHFDRHRSHLYVANHSSFWYGIVLYHWLRAQRRQPIYCMIDEAQVREHPFFRRVGGFSIDRTNPRDGVLALDHAAKLLNDSPASVILFPQGEIRHNDARPLAFQSGVGQIVNQSPASCVVSVALRYEFWKEQRAEAMLMAMPASIDSGASRHTIARALESQIEHGLSDLQEFAKLSRPGSILLQGKPSISKWKRIFGRGKV